MVPLRSPGTVVSYEKEEAKAFCDQCGEQKASFQYQFLLSENSCLSKVCLFFFHEIHMRKKLAHA